MNWRKGRDREQKDSLNPPTHTHEKERQSIKEREQVGALRGKSLGAPSSCQNVTVLAVLTQMSSFAQRWLSCVEY